MIKKSGLHAHTPKNVQKAFVSSGLCYDLNSSVPFVQFLTQLQSSTSLLCSWLIFILRLLRKRVPVPLNPSTAVRWVWSAFPFSPVSHTGTKTDSWGLALQLPALFDSCPQFPWKSRWIKAGYLGIHYKLKEKKYAWRQVFSTLLIKHKRTCLNHESHSDACHNILKCRFY